MPTAQYPKVYLYKRIVQAKLFIDSNYADNIDLDNIADEAFFSKFHFIRLFKDIYGKTPHQYLRMVRIANAVVLFRRGGTVSDVCHAVGFESLSSFGSLFKSITGTTPSAFLEKQRTLIMQMADAPLNFVPSCFISQYGWDKK